MSKYNPGALLLGFGRWLACIILLATVCALGNSAQDPWIILLPPQNGAITSSTTRVDLVNRYGAVNVRDQDVDVGEGETEPGTVVFPRDPTLAIEILWRDPKTKRSPKFLTIRGKASRWKTAHGVSLGTTLMQLEQINGKSFVLSGFGWDYSGTVESWQSGALAKDLEGHGRVILRLDTEPTSVTQQAYSELAGDRPFSSSNSAMQKLNPRIYEIVWEFPE
jgi:hypothetical protein